MNETITTKELAGILGISVQRVNQLGRKGKIQREPDGGWNLVKVNASLHRNLDKRQTLRSLGQTRQSQGSSAEGEEANAGSSFSEAQRQREWLRVQREEIELRKRRREVVEAADVKAAWEDIVVKAQDRLLSLPGIVSVNLAAVNDPRECEEILNREIREALRGLIEYQPNAA